MFSIFVGLLGDEEEHKRLKHIFKIIDKNKDGFLSLEEI